MANSLYPVSFCFSLSFKGEDAAFQEVSGLSKEFGMEEVVCGGENRFKYRLPTGVTSQNLVLKRALIPSGSELAYWCSSCLDFGFSTKIKTNDVSLSLLDADGQVSVMWTFHKAYPVKYSVSDFKSNENGIAIETLELAYTYFDVNDDKPFGNLFK
jgi:phage tail-like protein